jgi:hypothetical protein
MFSFDETAPPWTGWAPFRFLDGFGFLMRSSDLVVRPKELPNMLGNSSTASQCAASDDLQIFLAEPD